MDNAATSQKPAAVINAISHYYCRYNANAHRSSHRLGRESTDIIERTRKLLANYVGAASAQEIVFTRGATESINLVAHCYGEQLNHGDEILLTQAEHHANLVPWQRLAEKKGLVLSFLPSVAGVPQFDRLSEFISDRTRLFACTGASNVLGFKSPLATIKKHLANSNIPWLLDAAQLLAHGPVDISAIGCDFLVASAHKFYGPSGIGFLYITQSWQDKLSPWQSGGQMVSAVTLTGSDFQTGPLRFEAGTPSLAEIAGLESCLNFWHGLDVVALNAYEQLLINEVITGLQKLDSVRVMSPSQDNIGIASFWVEGVHGSDLAVWLDEYDIAVRVGQHCAAPLLQHMGVQECLRISVCAYNTTAEIDRFLNLLRKAIEQITTTPVGVQADTVESSSGIIATDLSGCNINKLRQQKSWQQRYRLLMQWSKVVPTQHQLRIEQYKVTGCEANTWLRCRVDNYVCDIAIDSDANIVKGLAVLLMLHVQGKTPTEVLAWDIDSILKELQLQRHLSESRINGFYAMWLSLKRSLTSSVQC